MRKRLKKIVSLLIACACVFSSVPNALADNETTASTLEQGTYTVTANLYVPGMANEVLSGTTAYLTNTQLPPLEGAVKNAKLEIRDDGKYLTVTNLNRFFALQKISSTEDAVKAMIISTETVSDYPQYYTSRINTITFKLNEDDDTYNFDDCEEFAVPLAGTGKANKTMPLQLKVDFSSAEQGFDDSQIGVVSWELNDSATGCKVIVSSSEESIIARMTNASLRVEEVTGDEKNSLFNKLSADYEGNVEGNIYNFVLEDGNKAVISLTGNSQASITFPDKYEQPIVYCFDDDNAVQVDNSVCIEEKTMFAVKTLGKYGFVNWKNRIHTIAYESNDNNVSFTYQFPMQYVDNKGYFSGNEGVSRVYQNNDDTEYYIGIQSPLFGGGNGAIYANGAKWNVTLPYTEGDHVYLVRHAKEKTGKNGKKFVYTERYYTVELNGQVSDNTITFDLFDESLGFSQDNREEIAEMTYEAYKGKKLLNNKTQIYFLVSQKQYADTPYPYLGSEAPDSSRDFTRYAIYTGKNCSAYMLGNNTTITGTAQATETDTNGYEFTVAPKEGYTWYSGDTETRTIKWYLEKAGLIAKYDGQVIRLGDTPEQRVTVTGFVNGETEETAASYIKPTVDFSGITAEGEYALKPANGSAKNYGFNVQEGTLKVLPATAKIIDKPTAVTGLKENNGETLIGVKEGEGYTLTNNTATKKGEYTAVAKLLDGYYWSDGTRDDVEIPWSVAKGSSSTPTNPTDKTQTVTANLYLDGKYNTVLPGITIYLNNPDNPIKGTGTPTVPQSDNATLTTTSDGDMLLTLDLPNPVFTLQKIGGGSNASIESTKTSSDLAYASGVKRKRDSRISKVIFKLNDKSGEYKFDDCEEFPTAINPDSNWKSPLVLKVQFKGGTDSSLDSNKNVDTSKVNGGTTVPTVKTDITVKVKDDTATVSKINTDDLSSKNSITLDVTDGNKGVTGVNLPVSALEKIVDAKVPGTTLTLSDTSAAFDLAALSAVTKAADKTVDLRILTGADAEKKLSAAQKTAMQTVKNASAVNVALSSNDKAITNLGGGKMTVSVPYKWDGKGAVRAYQTDENGKLVSVPVSCKNNVAVLTLTQPGAYVLGTVDVKAFNDVKDDAFYKAAVDWAVENGVTSGVSDTLFAPDATCTRAQVLTFLWRAAGSPEPTKIGNTFTDVKSDAYYYKAVLWALEKGITSGTSATTFAPDATVSRAQTVTFQWRMAGSSKADGTNAFTDVPTDSYYKDAVLWASKNGVTSGTSATTFAPENGCTRGQIVTFLYRQMNK